MFEGRRNIYMLVALVALVLVACSGSSSIEAGDPPAATAAAGASEEPVPTETADLEPTPTSAPSDASVSFAASVQPILEGHCASCHGTGGPGSTHMELATAVDAAASAFSIARLAESRIMPPWPASDLSVAFTGDHSLSDEQIDTIVAWADGGGGIDVAPDTPIVSTRPLARIEDPDLTLTSIDGPYEGSTDLLDDYRCLIFDPDVAEPEWILASHFEPDQVEVVHHAIVTLASAELRAQADAYDAADPGAGWTCYGGNGLRNDIGYKLRVGGWAPGGPPARRPAGFATPLNPGDFIVVQIHYHFDNAAPPDLSRMVFDLASDEEIEAAGGSFEQLQGQLYLGPAEIPCYEGDPHILCDRDFALKRVYDLYGPRQANLPDYFNAVCNTTPDDFADMTDGTAWSTCDLPVENPGRIMSLTGHMHELGQSIRLTLNPGTPDEQILLDIPDWQFEWQFGYQPVDEIILTADDTIRIECSWNRERAPYEAVGYILWAEGTGDEMCYSSITTARVDQ